LNEWSAVLKAITDRIAEFLNVFDLSFLVSGATCLSAFCFYYYCFVDSTITLNIPTLIFASYITGLICFTLGRWLRKELRHSSFDQAFEAHLKHNIENHGLSTLPEYASYFSKAEHTLTDPKQLYARLWADIRELNKQTSSLPLLNRYWVMAATYDGLCVASIVWLIVLELTWVKVGTNLLKLIASNVTWITNDFIFYCVLVNVAMIFVFISIRCSAEAGRYTKNQVNELAATIASIKFKNRG